jgi:peptide alpha-N-acetyltransferase
MTLSSATNDQLVAEKLQKMSTADHEEFEDNASQIDSSSASGAGINRRYDDDDDDEEAIPGIKFVNYRDESQLDSVMRLVGRDLSEPYSVFTYRYFLHRFPELCIFAVPTNSDNDGDNDCDSDGNGEPRRQLQQQNLEQKQQPIEPIGCVVCKIDPEDESEEGDTGVNNTNEENGVEETPGLCGYMAMLAVDTSYRRSGIGTALVKRVVKRMRRMGCKSVTLETEVSNKAAMKLYEERLGFVRETFLSRYYLNWADAYRLRLTFPEEGS